jgi:hypothetical protein
MYTHDTTSGQVNALPATCLRGEQFGDAVSLGLVEVK